MILREYVVLASEQGGIADSRRGRQFERKAVASIQDPIGQLSPTVVNLTKPFEVIVGNALLDRLTQRSFSEQKVLDLYMCALVNDRMGQIIGNARATATLVLDRGVVALGG